MRVLRIGTFFSIQLKLPGIKLIIFPLLGNQLIMTSSLDDFAVFQHHDRIRHCARLKACAQ